MIHKMIKDDMKTTKLIFVKRKRQHTSYEQCHHAYIKVIDSPY